jgi:hypothetical protein
MVERSIDLAATAIEAGDGCPALDKYLIPKGTETKTEWRALLTDITEANQAHRTKDPDVPELIIVVKPDDVTAICRRPNRQSGGENFRQVLRLIFQPTVSFLSTCR